MGGIDYAMRVFDYIFGFNNRDTEDYSAYKGRKIEPWGFQEILEINKHYVIKQIHVEPGEKLSLQYHNKKTETWIYQTNPPKIEHIPPGKIHRLVGPADILEVSTLELNDIVRLEDKYGRV